MLPTIRITTSEYKVFSALSSCLFRAAMQAFHEVYLHIRENKWYVTAAPHTARSTAVPDDMQHKADVWLSKPFNLDPGCSQLFLWPLISNYHRSLIAGHES